MRFAICLVPEQRPWQSVNQLMFTEWDKNREKRKKEKAARRLGRISAIVRAARRPRTWIKILCLKNLQISRFASSLGCID